VTKQAATSTRPMSQVDAAGALGISAATFAIMQRALALQMDAEFPEAKALFEEALADRGDNYNALNMLALVEYNLGNLDRAATLAAEAARLAPGLAAVQENQRIIAAARRVHAYRPFIFDPLADQHPPTEGAKPLVHLYKIAGNPAGGTEWRCIDLARRLRDDATVVLWTDNHSLAKIFTKNNPVRIVDPSRGDFPQGGTLVIAGSYHRVGKWYETARFRRVVLLYNVVDPIGAALILEQLCLPKKPKVELLFASEWLRRSAELPGHFEPSPIDTDLFSPKPVPRVPAVREVFARLSSRFRRDAVAAQAYVKPDSFVVGRLSRDDPMKYHAGAPEFYRKLATEGMLVRLMGAKSLASNLQGASGIEILPQSTIPAHEFLRSLDCFTYRTNPAWTEAWGRVVIEAMATGLPVVVHANGGYAQLIRHGENGFLFHRDDEAIRHIRNLAKSPSQRISVGMAARETIVELLSDKAFRRYANFYFQ
jgi:glycosyltransferase involved in cell wall biosynthesis